MENYTYTISRQEVQEYFTKPLSDTDWNRIQVMLDEIVAIAVDEQFGYWVNDNGEFEITE